MSNGTKQAPITTRQMQVMELVWSAGDITVREAKDALDDDLAYTSVLTVFQTLTEKGWVGHHQDGKAYRYYAEVERSEAAERVADWLLRSAPSLAHFVSERLRGETMDPEAVRVDVGSEAGSSALKDAGESLIQRASDRERAQRGR